MNTLSLISILLLAGSIQGLFLSTALFLRNTGHKSANRLLAVFILLFAAAIAVHTLGHADIVPVLHEHQIVISLLIFGCSPLLYLYTTIISGRKSIFNVNDFLHFLPVIMVSLLAYIIASLIKGLPDNFYLVVVTTFVGIHSVTYAVLTIVLVYHHMIKIRERFSSLDKINLKWILLLISLCTVTWIIGGLVNVLFPEWETNWDLVWAFVSVNMYLMGYFALSQIPVPVEGVTEKGDSKYKKSTLKEGEAADIKGKLENVMKVQKAYLTENLTLPALSHELSVSVHHLSQVINESYGMNFFEYINRYRIEEAKEILQTSNKTVTDICYEVGFSSLSAFNSSFKKYVGVTPTQYRNRNI